MRSGSCPPLALDGRGTHIALQRCQKGGPRRLAARALVL